MSMKKEHRKMLTELYLALGAILLDLDDTETETAQPKSQPQPQPKPQPKSKARAKAKTTAQPKTSGAKSKPKSGIGIRALRQDEGAKAKIAEMLSEGATVNAIATAVGATWEAVKKIIDETKNG